MTAAVPEMSSFERRDAALVAVDQAQRVVLLEVLELDQTAGPDLLHRGHERLHERVVLGAPQPRRPIPEIQRIGEQPRVVRPDVERHGQRQRGMDPARSRVQRELADRDGHPARPLVAQAEDPLVVGHHDEPHVIERALAQDPRDSVDIGRGDPHPAGPPDDVAELLARPPDGWGVDDRQELLELDLDLLPDRAGHGDPSRSTGQHVVERGGQGTHGTVIVRAWTYCLPVSAGPMGSGRRRCSRSMSMPRRSC